MTPPRPSDVFDPDPTLPPLRDYAQRVSARMAAPGPGGAPRVTVSWRTHTGAHSRTIPALGDTHPDALVGTANPMRAAVLFLWPHASELVPAPSERYASTRRFWAHWIAREPTPDPYGGEDLGRVRDRGRRYRATGAPAWPPQLPPEQGATTL